MLFNTLSFWAHLLVLCVSGTERRTRNFHQTCHIGFQEIDRSTHLNVFKNNDGDSYTIKVSYENQIIKLPASNIVFINDYYTSNYLLLKLSRTQKQINNVLLEIKSGGSESQIELEWNSKRRTFPWHPIKVGEEMVNARLFC